jgi:hypothetical protein
MRRSHMYAIVAITAWAGSIVIAQRVNSPEEFSRSMKTIGASVAAADKAIGSGAYSDAKMQLVLARQSLASTVPFWREKKTDEAMKLTRDTVAKLDALDTLLSAATVDSAAASNVFKQLTATCATCHTAYREGDQQSGYRFKQRAS